ncbi:MAG: glycyl-radical enzyme activating protein [Desulfomonilia bacterium]
MEQTVLVTEIQRFSVNDGPGFRTNVYLKGCPLRCAWCHNPETISPKAEIFWKKRLCIQCGACLDVCPRDAINPPIPPEMSRHEDSSYHKIIREKCDQCMKCVDVCMYDALQVTGRTMSVDEILDEVERDRPFYNNSGGGMTLSGGEPTAHPQFSSALLREARNRGIHTCIDTNGHCEFKVLEELSGYSDVVLYDLKHLDPLKHYEKTGVRNERILDNLVRLSRIHSEIWIRIPVVPDFNEDLEFHRKAAAFITSLGESIRRVDLLTYHNWCQDKYGWLGVDWEYTEVEALDPSFLEIHADIYREAGLRVTVGGSGFEEIGTAHRL